MKEKMKKRRKGLDHIGAAEIRRQADAHGKVIVGMFWGGEGRSARYTSVGICALPLGYQVFVEGGVAGAKGNFPVCSFDRALNLADVVFARLAGKCLHDGKGDVA